MSTPEAKSSFINASTVCGVGSIISINLLCVLDSNCSLLFLSMWGDLRTVYLSILVGKGIIEPTPQTVEALMKLDLASGVDIEIKI